MDLEELKKYTDQSKKLQYEYTPLIWNIFSKLGQHKKKKGLIKLLSAPELQNPHYFRWLATALKTTTNLPSEIILHIFKFYTLPWAPETPLSDLFLKQKHKEAATMICKGNVALTAKSIAQLISPAIIK